MTMQIDDVCNAYHFSFRKAELSLWLASVGELLVNLNIVAHSFWVLYTTKIEEHLTKHKHEKTGN